MYVTVDYMQTHSNHKVNHNWYANEKRKQKNVAWIIKTQRHMSFNN